MGLKRRVSAATHAVSSKVTGARFTHRLTRATLFSVLKQRGLEILYLLALLAFSAGIVNTILEGMRPEFAGAVILHNRAAQTMSEAMINIFTIALGTAGVYLVYMSGRQTVRHRVANLYMLLGFVTILLTLLIGLYIVDIKG